MSSAIVNTLVWGSQLGLVTLGFTLSYGVLRFASFAHIEFVTVGAYFGWVAVTDWQMSMPVAIVTAMIGTGIVSLSLDIVVFRRLQTASVAAKMLASIGLAIVIRSVVQFIFGAEAKFITQTSDLAFTLGNARVSQTQLMIIIVAALAMVVLAALLRFTKYGKMLRATADNFSLAEARGIDGSRVMSWAWIVSGGLAALGGVLIGAETFVRPSLGLTIVLPMFAAAVLGGLGNAYGAILGAFLLAAAQNFVLVVDFGSLVGRQPWLVGAQYKSALALIMLVVIVLVRPSGILARGLE